MGNAMLAWALGDLRRRPSETLLLAAVLVATFAVAGALLIYSRAVYETLAGSLEAAPALVVRRVDAAGWRPLPAGPAVRAARGVTGVTSARPRVWGTVAGPDGPLTVMGISAEEGPALLADRLPRLPRPGEALLGAAVGSRNGGTLLELEGGRTRWRVIGRLPASAGPGTRRWVLLHPGEARRVIGLAEGYARDVAVEVFHAEEQAAIGPDLAAAFPWPVGITTRGGQAAVAADRLGRAGALAVVGLMPAVLAVSLLVAVDTRRSMGRPFVIGMMKATGWTTGDIVRYQLCRRALVCLPAAALGSGLALWIVFRDGGRRIAAFFPGWEPPGPELSLDATGALSVLLELGGLIVVPVAIAALLPALRAAGGDVSGMIEGTRRP